MRQEKIVNGIRIVEEWPELTPEEQVERATYIVAGMEKILQAREARLKREAEEKRRLEAMK